jgi:hypothetical protein
MTMADIWLTPAARNALEKLPPAQAGAVNSAIGDITAGPGQQIDLPGAPTAEPFLAKEPHDSDAPALIYRRATTGEPGNWLVVSLMKRDDYRAARQAEHELNNHPARDFVYAVLADTVAAATATATARNVAPSPAPTGRLAPATETAPSRRRSRVRPVQGERIPRSMARGSVPDDHPRRRAGEPEVGTPDEPMSSPSHEPEVNPPNEAPPLPLATPTPGRRDIPDRPGRRRNPEPKYPRPPDPPGTTGSRPSPGR